MLQETTWMLTNIIIIITWHEEIRCKAAHLRGSLYMTPCSILEEQLLRIKVERKPGLHRCHGSLETDGNL